MRYAVSQIGDMVDFLKAFPFVSAEEYKWGLSVPMIRLMSYDNTHLIHLTKRQQMLRGAKDITLENDFGMTILSSEDNN